MMKKSNSKSSDYIFHSSFASLALQILYRRKMRSLVKPTMSLTLKKDSETHWCLMTLIGLHKRNWHDLLKETYGSLEILRNTVFFIGKHCSHAFLNTAWF